MGVNSVKIHSAKPISMIFPYLSTGAPAPCCLALQALLSLWTFWEPWRKAPRTGVSDVYPVVILLCAVGSCPNFGGILICSLGAGILLVTVGKPLEVPNLGSPLPQLMTSSDTGD